MERWGECSGGVDEAVGWVERWGAVGSVGSGWVGGAVGSGGVAGAVGSVVLALEQGSSGNRKQQLQS